MSAGRIIVRNICSTWVGFAVTIVTTLLLTPLVLSELGDVRYGIWALVHMLTGYYGLLDLGISAGITQYMARYLATRDFKKMNDMASTGFACLLILAGLLMGASLLLSALCPFIFNIPPEFVTEARICIVILGLTVSVQFVFFVYSAVFSATQRYDLTSAIAIINQLILALLMYVALQRGHGLVGLSVVHAVVNSLSYFARWRVAVRLLPQLTIHLRDAKMGSFCEFMTYGAWNMAIQAGGQLIAYTDAILIALFLTVQLVTPYSLASRLATYFARAFSPIANIFFPAFTALDARGDQAGLRKLYISSGRFMTMLALGLGAITYTWVPDFIRLWVGEEYVQMSPSVPFLFGLILLGEIFRSSQRAGYQVFLGTRRMSVLAKLLFLEGIVNLAVSVSLIHGWGITGVAVGALVSSLVFEAIAQPICVCQVIGMRLGQYVRGVLVRPLVVAAVLGLSLWPIRASGQAESWFELIVVCGLSLLLFVIIGIFIGLHADERKRFVTDKVRSVFSRRAKTLVDTTG